jgi:hypothetical protein
MFGFGDIENQASITHCVSNSVLQLFLSILQPVENSTTHCSQNDRSVTSPKENARTPSLIPKLSMRLHRTWLYEEQQHAVCIARGRPVHGAVHGVK